MNRLFCVSVLCAAASLCACAGQPIPADSPPPPRSLAAELRDPAGRSLARAAVEPTPSGILVRVEATGLEPGTYGLHLHAVGRCDPPAFASAGPHWNPGGKQHGRDNPQGMHKGDLPNLVVGADRHGGVEATLGDALPFGDPSGSILDEDGTAIVLHAGADDYRTDPSGNSGARIACGVLLPR